MYAAAGGASIANRRKQKRLQLVKPGDSNAAAAKGARARIAKKNLQDGRRGAIRSSISIPTTAVHESCILHMQEHARQRRSHDHGERRPVSPNPLTLSSPPVAFKSSHTRCNVDNSPFSPSMVNILQPHVRLRILHFTRDQSNPI